MSQEKFNAMMAISIHAPTRGATQQSFIQQTAKRFQSTLPREERHARSRFDYLVFQFQSTLPREERLFCLYVNVTAVYFNPRSHERSDDMPLSEITVPHWISIHAPTRGATNPLSVLCSLEIIFQSTLPREERQ